jgi:deazaflavin-dependent oxidoreductase (nitroreductase family)
LKAKRIPPVFRSYRQRVRRGTAARVWKVINPVTRPLAGYLPWWVLLETTGRRTGQRRLTPFANGPFDGASLSVIAVHGEHSGFAHNIGADPHVRVKRRGRWHPGTARLVPADEASLAGFGRYPRSGLRTFGHDPMVLRIDFDAE